jgi:hypothetical protein
VDVWGSAAERSTKPTFSSYKSNYGYDVGDVVKGPRQLRTASRTGSGMTHDPAGPVMDQLRSAERSATPCFIKADTVQLHTTNHDVPVVCLV